MNDDFERERERERERESGALVAGERESRMQGQLFITAAHVCMLWFSMNHLCTLVCIKSLGICYILLDGFEYGNICRQR